MLNKECDTVYRTTNQVRLGVILAGARKQDEWVCIQIRKLRQRVNSFTAVCGQAIK